VIGDLFGSIIWDIADYYTTLCSCHSIDPVVTYPTANNPGVCNCFNACLADYDSLHFELRKQGYIFPCYVDLEYHEAIHFVANIFRYVCPRGQRIEAHRRESSAYEPDLTALQTLRRKDLVFKYVIVVLSIGF